MNILNAQTVYTYSSNGMGMMQMQGQYGTTNTTLQANPDAIMIEFVDGGVKISQYNFSHFYPYMGISNDGLLMYYDQSMVNQNVLGIFAEREWERITVVKAISNNLGYAEVLNPYTLYGKGKESYDRFWEIQTQIQSSSNHINPGLPGLSNQDNVERRTCYVCKGAGVEIHYFGSSDYVWCNECGKKDIKHYHRRCTTCNGKGHY